MENLRNFSLKMLLSTLYPTMTITNQRSMSLRAIPTLKGQLCQWWDWQTSSLSDFGSFGAQWCYRRSLSLLDHGLGSPNEYADSVVSLRPGLEISRDKLWMTWSIFSLSEMILIPNGEGFVRWGCGWDFPSPPESMRFSSGVLWRWDWLNPRSWGFDGSSLGRSDHLDFPSYHLCDQWRS